MDSFERMQESRLPPKEAFHNILSNEQISDVDYAHAHKVWEAFDMENLWDYHDLYLVTDVLLLADVFESLREMSMTNYKNRLKKNDFS